MMRLPDWKRSGLLIAERVSRWMRSPVQQRRYGRLLYALALVIFVTALILSYRILPRVTPVWSWFAITATAAVAVLFISGLEYRIAGRMLGHRIGMREAVGVSVLSSAANLLPLPGAVLVRSQALKLKGSAYGSAFQATGAIGAGWLGAAFSLAGLLALSSGRYLAGVSFVIAGAVALALMIALVKLAGASLTASCLWITGVETVFVLLSAVRLYSVLHGIGVDASITQAITLTIAAALANAAGIFPGGMGLRELLAGALGPLIGLPIAAGVLSAAVDRLVGLTVLALAALAVITLRGAEDSTSATESG